MTFASRISQTRMRVNTKYPASAHVHLYSYATGRPRPLGANATRGVAKYSNSVTAAVTCDNAVRARTRGGVGRRGVWGYRPGVTGVTRSACSVRRREPTPRARARATSTFVSCIMLYHVRRRRVKCAKRPTLRRTNRMYAMTYVRQHNRHVSASIMRAFVCVCKTRDFREGDVPEGSLHMNKSTHWSPRV